MLIRRAALPLGPGDQGAEALGHLVLGHQAVALGVDHGDERVDAPHQVGAAGGRVLVGRLVEGLDGQVDRLVPAQALAVAELDGGAGVTAARAGGLEVGVLVVAAGGVVAEDAADAPGGVVAGEERHHHEALHGHGQVLAHHLGQLVGLALEGEGRALDLLVVLELDLEEADHLHRHAGRAGDGHGASSGRPGRPSPWPGGR